MNYKLKGNQGMTLNLSTHAPPVESTLQWDGLQSAKFNGSRSHQNHPRDQLDQFLIGSKSTQINYRGKRQFASEINNQINQNPKVHLRTFDVKYKRSTVFDQQNIIKLIKVPFVSDSSSKPALKAIRDDKYNYSLIGKSKIKALQNGTKHTGIYRNFYKSLNTSANFIHIPQ